MALACHSVLLVCRSQDVPGKDVESYLNGCVRDVREELVTQLLATEHCSGTKDLKEYVSRREGGSC